VPAGGPAAVRRISAGGRGGTRVVATHSTAVRVCPMKVFQPDEHPTGPAGWFTAAARPHHASLVSQVPPGGDGPDGDGRDERAEQQYPRLRGADVADVALSHPLQEGSGDSRNGSRALLGVALPIRTRALPETAPTRGEIVHQPRLVDACFAGQHHHPPRPSAAAGNVLVSTPHPTSRPMPRGRGTGDAAVFGGLIGSGHPG
jgi:hypothetical protein